MSVDVTDLSPSPEEVATPPQVEAGSDTSAYEPPTDPTPAEDIERLLPAPGEPFELADGTRVIANPLRMKELLSLLKIITRGAAIALGEVRLNTNDDEFAQSMISLFIFAIPEAEDEAADFLRKMVRPAGPFTNKIAQDDATIDLDEKLANPDLEDLFTIIEIVMKHEGRDLRRLGKRLAQALAFAQKTGQA